jgi:predicted nucleotidyltransferase
VKGLGVTLEEKTALDELKRALRERYGVTSVVVYGSKARGDDSPDSDIDVMIVLDDYTPQIEAVVDEMVYEINLAHDCLISVVIFGRRELEEGPLGESPLYKRILAEGVPV